MTHLLNWNSKHFIVAIIAFLLFAFVFSLYYAYRVWEFQRESPYVELPRPKAAAFDYFLSDHYGAPAANFDWMKNPKSLQLITFIDGTRVMFSEIPLSEVGPGSIQLLKQEGDDMPWVILIRREGDPFDIRIDGEPEAISAIYKNLSSKDVRSNE